MLSQDFKEFIALLNDHSVKYLVVGGYAVAVHGHPRYTKDLDIWIGQSRENAGKIIHVLNDFGFGSLALSSDDFLVKDQIIQLGYPPNRIDLITTLQDVVFDECYSSKIQVKIDEVIVNFIDNKNLIKNKKATGRLQDLADAENLDH